MSEDGRDIAEEIGDKDRRRKIIIWVVVAIVVVAIIGVTTLFTKNSDPVEATELTIEGVNTEVQDVKSRVATLETKVATQAEDIANLATDIGEGTFTDWTTDINTLYSRITAVENLFNDLRYAVVTRAEPGYVDVQLFGAGDYAVVTTLYGIDLTGIAVRYPALYSITRTWATNTSVTVAVEPITVWASGDLVELKLTGTLHYAAAVIGQGCEGIVSEW